MKSANEPIMTLSFLPERYATITTRPSPSKQKGFPVQVGAEDGQALELLEGVDGSAAKAQVRAAQAPAASNAAPTSDTRRSRFGCGEPAPGLKAGESS